MHLRANRVRLALHLTRIKGLRAGSVKLGR